MPSNLVLEALGAHPHQVEPPPLPLSFCLYKPSFHSPVFIHKKLESWLSFPGYL